MAGEQEKGLASSIWARAPRDNNRSPYYFHKSTSYTKSSVISQASSTQLSQTEPFVSPQTTSSATTNGAAPGATGPSATQPQQFSHNSSLCTDLESALRRIPTPWAELARFTKIVRRLQWKLPFLSLAYDTATEHSNSSEERRREAELMFKLDFFEYYMLLERALVHLLGVFGIKVTGGFGGRLGQGTSSHRQNGWEQGDHRFHANVLEALEDPQNPLCDALGANEVRTALARAKELRNRWKNADDPDATLANGSQHTRPLKDYDLGRILNLVFAGLEHGFRIADDFVNEVRALADRRGVNGKAEPASEQSEEWEFMTDAMDWEAV